jgi:hypothetical protein
MDFSQEPASDAVHLPTDAGNNPGDMQIGTREGFTLASTRRVSAQVRHAAQDQALSDFS